LYAKFTAIEGVKPRGVRLRAGTLLLTRNILPAGAKLPGPVIDGLFVAQAPL
jgi:hypothetical protein